MDLQVRQLETAKALLVSLAMLVLLPGMSTIDALGQTPVRAMGSDAETPAKRKVILFGMDGMMPEQIDRYKNDIPELAQFVDKGFFSPAIESPYTDTGTNWNTIETGAWVGTHGMTGFEVHLPGMRLGESMGGENTGGWPEELMLVDDLFHAAERQGKRVVEINYPDAFPKLLKDGVVIGGKGLGAHDWQVRGADYISSFRQPRNGKRMILGDKVEWKNVPQSYKVLQQGLVFLNDQQRFGWSTLGMVDVRNIHSEKGERRYFLIFKEGNSTKVLIADSADAAHPIAVLEKGQWSGWVHENFAGSPTLRQYKVLDLDAEGTQVSIYGTPAPVLSGWGYPRGIEQSIVKNAGAYLEGLELAPNSGVGDGWYDWDVAYEIMRLQTDFLRKCAGYINKTQGWDLMAVVIHAPDGVNHMEIGKLESNDPAMREAADGHLRETLRILFQMASGIVRDIGDANTVVCFVSDHGNLPKTHWVNVQGILMHGGWTKFVKDQETGLWNLDTKHSVAVYGNTGVWINVKGREKDGIVEPGKEYENLRTRIIQRLREVKDPETGEDAYALVGRREDMEGLGIWGDRTEDIIAFERPHYFAQGTAVSCNNAYKIPEVMMKFYQDGPDMIPWPEAVKLGFIWGVTAVHWGLPTSSAGFASNRATFLISGKGVVEGKRAARVNLVDVAPTLSYFLGIRPPEQCEGRVVMQAVSK
jgi:predicted AlkP superfamily phosphohydrolase/phosphomutase